MTRAHGIARDLEESDDNFEDSLKAIINKIALDRNVINHAGTVISEVHDFILVFDETV